MYKKLLLINRNFLIKGSLWLPLIFFFDITFAQQNLVPNPSFETYITCNIQNYSPPPPPWYMPTTFIGCYFNKCSTNPDFRIPNNGGIGKSYQYARTGNAYIGLFYVNGPPYSDARNYYQVKLNDSLQKNKKYNVSCYVNTFSGSNLVSNNIGILLTNKVVYADTNTHAGGILSANPQILNYGNPVILDTLNWVKVSGIYKAKGGEQYLTLGNFSYDTQTLYKQFQPNGYPGALYFLDDVSVIPLDSMCLKADAGKDTTINIGDSIFIGSYTNGIDSIKWLLNGVAIDSIRPGFWVKPTTGTSYILQQTVNGCFSADTVFVNVQPLPLKFTIYELRFTNEKQVENIWVTANEINVSYFNIQRSLNGREFINIGQVKAQNKSINEYTFFDSPPVEGLGVVYYRIESIDKDGKKQYSEIRIVNLKIETLNGFSIYPNPSNGSFVVKLQNAEKGLKQFKLVDMFGKIVWQKEYSYTNADIKVATNVTAGVYILQIVNTKTGKTNVTKVIIN